MEDDKGKAIVEENKPFSNVFLFALRVLIVDSSETCLFILEKMLQSFGHEVTKCHQAKEALCLLREDRSKYDIVLTGVHMPGMDGFKLLEIVSSEMDNLPFIMVSSDENPDTILKAILLGCCDYLVKPVNKDSLRQIWQHVVRKRKNEFKELERTIRAQNREDAERQETIDSNGVKEEDEQERKGIKRVIKDDLESADHDDIQDQTLFCVGHMAHVPKKPRLVWSAELHHKFVAAVRQIGYDKAVPKKILETMQNMGVQNLSRENIASHLQKYRLYIKKAPSDRQSATILNDDGRVSSQQSYELGESCKYNPCVNGGQQYSFQNLSLASESIDVRIHNHFHDPQVVTGSNNFKMAQQQFNDIDHSSTAVGKASPPNMILQPNLKNPSVWNANNQCRQAPEEAEGDRCFGYQCENIVAMSNSMDSACIQLFHPNPNMYIHDFPTQNITPSFTEEYENLVNTSSQNYNELLVANGNCQSSHQFEEGFGPKDFMPSPFMG